MARGEIFMLPDSNDLLHDCREWQAAINSAPSVAAKDEIGRQACSALFGRQIHAESRRIITRSDAAIVLPHMRPTAKESTRALQFNTVTTKGHQGNVNYMRIQKEGILTLPVYDAQVMNHDELDMEDIDPVSLEHGEYMPANRPLRLPVQLPVGLIDYVIPAA